MREYSNVRYMIRLSLFVAIIGWISTIIYRIQLDYNSNLTDCFTFLKFFLIFFLSIYYLQRSNFKRIITIVFGIAALYLILGFICLIINQFIDIGMTFEQRYGLKSFMFINPNPGDYENILILSLIILHITSYYTRQSYTALKIITIILILSTLRGKAIGFIATYIILVIVINRYNRISTKSLIILVTLGIIGGYSQIRYYFLDNVTPRSVFVIYGLETANDYFPFGSGYSTYGSNMAKINYSPLYTEYGFNNIWGMNEEEQQFLNDNFWPMIMGQYGWIGLIIYIGILLIMFKLINNEIFNRQLKIAGFSIFFSLVYSSVGGPVFVHYIGCASIVIFSLILKANKIDALKHANI